MSISKMQTIPLHKILISLFCIVLIRIFFESFSSPAINNQLFPWTGIYLHIPLFYLSIFLSLSILLYWFTKNNIQEIFVFLLNAHLLILIPPLFDLIITKGSGISMHYIFTYIGNIPNYFFLFANPFFQIDGVTWGMRLAILLLFVLIFLYIYKTNKNKLSSFFSLLIAYFIFIFYATLPSFFITEKVTSISYIEAFKKILTNSLIYRTQNSNVYLISIENINNILLSQIFWLFVVFQTIYIFYKTHNDSFPIIKNVLRIGRILNFFLLAFIGIFISMRLNGGFSFSPINIVTLAAFFVLLLMILAFSVFLNDAEDKNIDEISNKDRPLANGLVTMPDWNKLSLYLFVIITIGLLSINKISAFFLILLAVSYYLYSVHPLRLKKHFISSSILIGLATTFTSMAGYFLVSGERSLSSFPLKAILIIGISQGLISNMKDIKDYKGDKKENIKTIPVVFGEKNAKRIISMLWFIVYISIPLILNTPNVLPFSIILSLITAFFFLRKHYEEKYIFMTMFLYMIILFFSFI